MSLESLALDLDDFKEKSYNPGTLTSRRIRVIKEFTDTTLGKLRRVGDLANIVSFEFPLEENGMIVVVFDYDECTVYASKDSVEEY